MAAPTKTEEPNPPAKRQYHALTRSPEELAEILSTIQENLAGETITPRELQKITVPSQGVTKWIIPNAETGKKDALDEIEGIMIYVGTPRAYWSKPLDMANRTPPDCSSLDGHVGVGNPGGSCNVCPFNKWGTAKTGSGKGKACKEQRLIYMIRPDDFLPTVLQAPVTSIDQLKKHMMRLATTSKSKSKPQSYKEVYTKMTLNEITSDFPYSEIVFELADPVEDEYLPQLKQYVEAITPIVSNSSYQIEPIEEQMALEASGQAATNGAEPSQGTRERVNEAPNVAGQVTDPVNDGVTNGAASENWEPVEGQGQLAVDPDQEPAS